MPDQKTVSARDTAGRHRRTHFPLRFLLGFLSELNQQVLQIVSLALVALTGWLDYRTGYEMSFSVFYLVPVLLAAWYVGRNWGLFIAVGSAASWLIANWEEGQFLSHPMLIYWNAFVRLGFFVVVTILASKLKVALQHEAELARCDFLTGAVNSRFFEEISLQEILRARRYGHPFTVVYVDCDNFKKINDEMGHSGGDDLLRFVVDEMHSSLRATDVVARLGGDEFALLLPESSPQTVPVVLAKLQRDLSKAMRLGNWSVTFSIGAVTFEVPPDTIDSMIQLADSQMYVAKQAGKNRISHQVFRGTEMPK